MHVLSLLHEELHGPGPLGVLSSLAQTEVTLSGALGQASAHILYRRPQQRPTHQVRSTGELEVGVRAIKRLMRWSTSLGSRGLSIALVVSPQLPCEVDCFIIPIL